jgi:excisionase family DNA binding protein
MQSQVTRLYRVKAVAEMFDVSVTTIYRAIGAGKLEALKIGAGKTRGSVRIPEYALKPFEEACAEAAYATNGHGIRHAEDVDERSEDLR